MNQEIDFLTKKIIDLNKKLMYSEKNKSLFLSLVANRLNNPISVLIGMVPKLRDKDVVKQVKIIDLIEQETVKLDFYIQNLIAAAEIESGKISFSFSAFQPKTLIQECIASLNPWVQEYNVLFDMNIQSNSPFYSDPSKFKLLIKNLIINAVQHSDLGTNVEITLDIVDSNLLFAVTNNGYLENVDQHAYLFTRFAETMEGSGLGIGLSIVKELLELLDGSISVESNDSKITFAISIPEISMENKKIDAIENNIFFDMDHGMLEL